MKISHLFLITLGSVFFVSSTILAQVATDLNCISCVQSTEIQNNAVTGPKIQFNAVTTLKILDGTITNTDISSTASIDASKISGTAWTSTNDGGGTGLDADLLDGVDASTFLRSDQTGAITGDLSVSGSLTSSTNMTSAGSVVGNELCIGSDCRSAWPAEGEESPWDDAGDGTISYSGGNVGIGMTSPEAKLQVGGTVRLYDSSSAYGIYFEPAGAENVGIHKLSNEGAPWGGSFTSFDDFTPTTADLLLFGHEGISLGTRQSEDILGMRVTSSGNVGIGTTAPAEKLEVAGNIKLSGNIKSDGDICIGQCE